ncbi:MAG: hypothetical protein ACI9F9_001682 [Candidatus Paceibacteria bacterium]|jgi:hypothetical protein
MKSILKAVFGIALLLMTSSCASDLTATASPDASLSKDLTYYVAHYPDDNSEVNVDVCNELQLTGRTVTTGEMAELPEDLDVLVTYVDSWVWDMNMYILSLDINFRDASTEQEIASGRSMATSLIRQSQKWHANALVTKIIEEVHPEEAAASATPEE